ncbi:unnamed protein product [Symbiodinium sp. CCMP2592]|nr:unnamed protein product [Symbiodinium sp. CCMP2592]
MQNHLDVFGNGSNETTMKAMISCRDELLQDGVTHAKALITELMLCNQLLKIKDLETTDPNGPQLKPAREDLLKLTTKMSVLFQGNCFNVTSNEVQPKLWQAAQKYAA